ncbi:MAG: hypothetical protein OQJ89_10760 [Kangiellaceae bacterium]|nr:hypothetical protein [Kangiellaceae bacterium]MCW8999499.1 hypothetical protein [Kangiellaceae bacterium]MCW9017437.1 hypothetical protein [Kangiellaceae bacterium]
MKRIKLSLLKIVLLTPIVIFGLFYIFGVITVLRDDRFVTPLKDAQADSKTIAIFGASGTAGDGILKAALASPDIENIHVITRRITPRMEEGIKSGKAQMTIHKDYLDYSAVIGLLAQVDAVYWAIGLSSIGVDEKTYGMIHVEFPTQFVKAWSSVSQKENISFHYISSSDISDESTAMWAREKVRAEKSLFAFAQGTKMRVIAYRPDYIGPTQEDGHLGQEILYYFFSPVGVAVRAEQIGQAMLEVSARWQEFDNGDKLHTSKIIRYSDAYEGRQ